MKNTINKNVYRNILVAVLLICCVQTIFSSNTSKQLEAFFSDITIAINGEVITPKDVNGTVVEPFIVDGTTYLPVRAISEALDMDVTWDQAAQRVWVDTKPTEADKKIGSWYSSNSWVLSGKDNWIYYLPIERDELRRMRADGSENTQLVNTENLTNLIKSNHDHSFWYGQPYIVDINIAEDWIYFILTWRSDHIYKCKTDGTELQHMESAGSIPDMQIAGDWIYYHLGEGIYKMRTDGTERTLLYDKDVSKLCVMGSWIYVKRYSPYSPLFKIRTDGTRRADLTVLPADTITVTSNGIYYEVSDHRNSYLYQADLDGKNPVKIIESSIKSLDVAEDMICYTDDAGIHIVDPNGTNDRLLASGFWEGGFIFDNCIIGYDEHIVPFRIMLDGSGIEEVNIYQN